MREEQLTIFGSITGAEPTALGEAALRLLNAGVDGLHIDIADGVFVPYLTFGPSVVAALRRMTAAILDVHLMVSEPERLIESVADSGATRISFHLEATRYPWRVTSLIRRAGVQAGVALNPITSSSGVEALADTISFVNLLTTDPDVAGERLLPRMPERVAAVRGMLPEGKPIEVDGGIDADNIKRLSAAGATQFVVGRAICQSLDWTATVVSLRRATQGSCFPALP
jgi:ribulose-phosphate 3-epimerase